MARGSWRCHTAPCSMLQLRQRGICTVVWASTSCWGEGLGVALMAEQLLIVRVLSVVNLPFSLDRHPAACLRSRDNRGLCQV